MSSEKPETLPPGRQPYDPLNGLRVGGLAGGILGVLLVAFTPLSGFWVVLACAAVVAAIGYWTERLKLSGEDSSPDGGSVEPGS